MTELNAEMKEGLAQVFSNKGFRSYLEHRIAKANQAIIEMLADNKLEEAKKYAQRLQMMSELLSKGREQFNNFNKIKAKKDAIQE
jgi:hypothetical protein